MDTSEIYIKMCDCLEIQGKKYHIAQPYRDGNYYWDKVNKKMRIDSYPGGKDTSTWLPRQDQIQEILGCKDIQVAHQRLYQLHEFWIGRDLKSMEQLWLAFYMHEKHNKTWDGEKWKANKKKSISR